MKSTIDYIAMRKSMLAVISEYGIPEGIIDLDESSANNIITTWKYLSSRLDESGMVRFEKKVENASREIELRDVKNTRQVIGADKVLSELRSRGYATGILTRGSRAYATTGLSIAGLQFEEDCLVCRDDHGLMDAKPNPIALKRASDAIGIPMEKCIYVGDHLMDYQCAKAAGVGFVGVLSGYNDRDRWRGIDEIAILNTIVELPRFLESQAE